MPFGKFSFIKMAKYWKIVYPSGHTGYAQQGFTWFWDLNRESDEQKQKYSSVALHFFFKIKKLG